MHACHKYVTGSVLWFTVCSLIMCSLIIWWFDRCTITITKQNQSHIPNFLPNKLSHTWQLAFIFLKLFCNCNHYTHLHLQLVGLPMPCMCQTASMTHPPRPPRPPRPAQPLATLKSCLIWQCCIKLVCGCGCECPIMLDFSLIYS